MSHYPDHRNAPHGNAVTPTRMDPGDRVLLGPDGRRWWTVRAVSAHYAVCVQQVPFRPGGTLRYTVLDWRNGVRGPCNRIGQGFGDGSYSAEDCEEMLADFEDGALAVSHRNWVPLAVEAWEATSRDRVPA